MDRVEFETALREEGYLEVADRRMEPNQDKPRAFARVRRAVADPPRRDEDHL